MHILFLIGVIAVLVVPGVTYFVVSGRNFRKKYPNTDAYCSAVDDQLRAIGK